MLSFVTMTCLTTKADIDIKRSTCIRRENRLLRTKYKTV